jgi:transcription factor MYB, plant
MLLQLVAHHGCKKWSHIASFLHGRLGKQCRERYAFSNSPRENVTS